MSTRSDQRKDAAEHGLYDPAYEHDACGVGFVASVKGQASHEIVTQALQILKNLDHRGAVGADPLCGDGAGILIQIPDAFFRRRNGQAEYSSASGRRLWRRHDFPAARTRLLGGPANRNSNVL